MTEKNYTYEEVVLGALLHDIGKMVIRLKGGELYNQNDAAGYRYIHAKETHEFLKNQLIINGVPNIKWENVSVLAAMHHNPSDDMQKIIQRADWWSSGLDREEKKEVIGKADIHLAAFFSKDKTIPFKDYSDMGSEPFPMFAGNLDIEKGFAVGTFEEHAQHLVKHLKGVSNPAMVVDCVTWFLKEYMYCTPSDMLHAIKISLYDHALTTAAIASALYKYCKKEGCDIEKVSSQSPIVIIAGGVDGIQKFISAIQGTTGASRALRGRSVFIQIFTEYVKNRLLKELGLYSPSVVMNAAGKFWIIAPNTEDALNAIDNVRVEIETLLADKLCYQLAFNIGCVSCGAEDFSKNNFRKLYERIKESVQASESRPFATVLKEHYLLQGASDSGHVDSCPLCKLQSKSDDVENCDICAAMMEIGKDLPKAKNLVWRLDKDENSYLGKLFNDGPRPCFDSSGDYLSILNDENVFCLENIEFEKSKGDKSERVIIPHRAIGRHVPGDLYDLGDGRYLGALKVDVDDLGMLFKSNALKSMSHVSTFSRVMDFFFTEFAQYQLENNSSYRDKIYTVFSGGDDFFVLGDLKSIVDFAFYMKEKFDEYTGNSEIHFSAGITVHHRHYPVRYIADAVEKELRLAKVCGKNSISFQGDTKTWNEAIGWKKLADTIMEKKWCPTSMNETTPFKRDFWRRLLSSCYDFMRVSGIREDRKISPNDYLYDAHLKYYLARNYKNIDGEPGKLIEKIKTGKAEDFLKANYTAIRLAIWLAREREDGI